jgi:hypothetical protein
MRAALTLFLLLALGCCSREAPPPPGSLVVWAWERPEDLRFLAGEAEIALLAGFVELKGGEIVARGRRFPLKAGSPPSTAVVHVEIAPGPPVPWTADLRRRLAATVLHYATAVPSRRVQIDFEVRASQRTILLDLLGDVRRGLPPGTPLSMTAIASWCDTEAWLSEAPVDEIVPMLFRMGERGEILKKRLAKGLDFRNPRCRTALGISTDSPVGRAPPGRRVYLFSPRSWNERDFRAARRAVEGWR